MIDAPHPVEEPWKRAAGLLAMLLATMVSAAAFASKAEGDGALLSARRVAAAVDAVIESRDAETPDDHDVDFEWQLADGPTFYRRVSLDLIGRIPTAAEARRHCDNDSAEHRREVIDEWCRSAAFNRHVAKQLVRFWFPQTSLESYRYLSADSRAWIARGIAEDRPLNQIARELIAVPYSGGGSPRSRHLSPAKQPQADHRPDTPRALIAANHYRAADMASNVTRHFLGVDLSCAQCHDHPFERWTRDQFWQTAAFFQRMPAGREADGFGSIAIPETDRRVQAALFSQDSTVPPPPNRSVPDAERQWFSDWVAAADNPYFARHSVNLFWNALTGTVLVPTAGQQPVGKADRILELLSESFVASDFDTRHLIRCITFTRFYQSASATNRSATTSPKAPPHRTAVRGLDGEQLFDSLYTAAGRRLLRGDLDPVESLHQRREFCQQMDGDGVRPNRSIAQTLTLLNGSVTGQLSDPEHNPTIRSLALATFLDESECIASLYWSVLGRPPHNVELAALRESGLMDTSPETRMQRYGKLFWLLVNTIEFNTNH